MADRFLNVFIPAVGGTGLKLASLSGREGISQLFEFQLDLVSEFSGIPAKDMIAQNIVIEIVMGNYKRYINGYISRFAQLDSTFRFTRYSATVVPWLYFLTKKSGCKIFQDKKVFEIVEKVINGQPRPPSKGSAYLTLFDMPQQGFETRSYTVQYRETDFNFVSRLMEEEGIYYFFQHTADQHKLIVSDSKSSHPSCPEMDTIPFHVQQGGGVDDDMISSFRFGREFHSGEYVLTAYDYQKPANNFQFSVPSLIMAGNNGPFELYDHSADFVKGLVGQAPAADEADAIKVNTEASKMTAVRMQEEEIRHKVGAGTSTCATITSGHKFTLEDFPKHTFPGAAEDNFNREYLITHVQHSAFDSSLVSGEDVPVTYTNNFWCIPSDVVFRPPRITAKPLVHGMQTATVTGPPGSEIHSDKYGRVKVQFYWDRTQKFDDSSSCWIRVSEPWAGKNWGAVFLPRVGHEVVVAFLEGDPDQPLIVGRVYNAVNMPPWELPANQTQSGVKTRSSAGGGASNFNEIRFEDKKGQEEVYVHAERNLRTMVEANEQRDVGGDRTTTIGKNDTLHVMMDSETTIDQNETRTVLLDFESTIGQNSSTTIGMDETVTVGMNAEKTVGISQKVTVGAQLEITAGGIIKITTPTLQIQAAAVQVTSGAVQFNTPVAQFSGVVQCTSLIAAAAVVSPSYTPGAGNIL